MSYPEPLYHFMSVLFYSPSQATTVSNQITLLELRTACMEAMAVERCNSGGTEHRVLTDETTINPR